MTSLPPRDFDHTPVYKAGVQAFYFGHARQDNPEPKGFCYDIWECGWLDAHDQHQSAKQAVQEWYDE